MPNPSGVAMQEGWGDPDEVVTIPLAVAKTVRNHIMGDFFDVDLIEEFLRAVEKAEPNR
jgi:hypothetical protein